MVSRMYILNEVCYLTTSIGSIYFFYNSIIISREHLNPSIYQRHCVYFTTLVATIHIITSNLRLIWEKLNAMFIWGKPLQPCPFKGAYSFYRTSCSNICLKSAAVNSRKHLHPPDCLLANVLIYNFTTVIAAIH